MAQDTAGRDAGAVVREVEVEVDRHRAEPGDGYAPMHHIDGEVADLLCSYDPSSRPIWSATVHLAAGVRIHYEFATRHPDGSVTWESGDNRLLRVPIGTKQAVFEGT